MSLETLRTLDNRPLDCDFETSLHIMGDTYSMTDLLQPFEGSEYLRLLSLMNPRFSKRQWTEDNAKFLELMGPDVDPVQHGIYQARTIAIPMAVAQLSSCDNKTEEMTSLSSMDDAYDYFIGHHVVHDMHEGVYEKQRGRIVDTITHEKTKESEAAEFEVQRTMIEELFDPEAEQHFLANIDDQANGCGFNSLIWNASEVTGYVSTGLQALAVHLGAEDLNDLERSKCAEMARWVVGNNISRLKAARSRVVYVDEFLVKNEPNFKKICEVSNIKRQELESAYNG